MSLLKKALQEGSEGETPSKISPFLRFQMFQSSNISMKWDDLYIFSLLDATFPQKDISQTLPDWAQPLELNGYWKNRCMKVSLILDEHWTHVKSLFSGQCFLSSISRVFNLSIKRNQPKTLTFIVNLLFQIKFR